MKVYLIFRDGHIPQVDVVKSSKKKAEKHIADDSGKHGDVWYEARVVE